MIRWSILLLLLFSAGTASARVLVIGIDGASWNVIDPMFESDELPNLRALVERGLTAEMDTVEPLTSPVVWTSIATGRSPEAHGITDFFSTRATIAVPTIYERLAAHGKRVGLYEVLMTWPPPALPGGFVIPAWLRRDESTWPPDATQGLPIFRTIYQAKPRNRDYLEQAIDEGRRKAGSWKKLAERFDPEVGALTFYAVDATSHRYWHTSFPDEFGGETPEAATDERNAVQRALRGVDRSIGEITADLDLSEKDAVLVVSDHGFQAAEGDQDVWITRFEDLLAKHDLVPGRDKFRLISTFFAVTIRVAPGPFDERDRLIEQLSSLLRSYQSLDGDQLMFTTVLDVAERPAGMERSYFERLRQWAIRHAMDWAFDTKVDPTAQAMIVALPRSDKLDPLWPDSEIRVDGVREPLRSAIYRQRFTGTHAPTAVFIAAGAPFQKRAERGRVSVLDIAPLVAYLAGSPIPDDFEGRVPIDWIAPAFIVENPIRTIRADVWPRLPIVGADSKDGGNPGPMDAETRSGAEDPALVETLRALGYIE